MPLSKMKIGFVGLGLMGAPMARNLLTSGAILLVNNRTAKKCAPLVALGAKASPSPREMAKQVGAGIIVLCVSDTPSLCTALSGPEGILSGIAPGTLVIDMGTTEVSATKQMAYRVEQSGGRYLDAPVSGGEVGARDATLSIMVGGAPKDVERGRAIFNVLIEKDFPQKQFFLGIYSSIFSRKEDPLILFLTRQATFLEFHLMN